MLLNVPLRAPIFNASALEIALPKVKVRAAYGVKVSLIRAEYAVGRANPIFTSERHTFGLGWSVIMRKSWQSANITPPA